MNKAERENRLQEYQRKLHHNGETRVPGVDLTKRIVADLFDEVLELKERVRYLERVHAGLDS